MAGLIEVKDVVAGYGGAPILNGVSIAIEQSDIGVIVGPNGAGKSTTLKAIFGLLRVASGTISFAGEEITNSLPDKLVPRGLGYVSSFEWPTSRSALPGAWAEVRGDFILCVGKARLPPSAPLNLANTERRAEDRRALPATR